jgi:hypothetical protein
MPAPVLAIDTQTLIIGGLVALLLVLIVVRQVGKKKG